MLFDAIVGGAVIQLLVPTAAAVVPASVRLEAMLVVITLDESKFVCEGVPPYMVQTLQPASTTATGITNTARLSNRDHLSRLTIAGPPFV